MKLRKIADLEELIQRGRQSLNPAKAKIRVGMATCGQAAGAGEVYGALAGALAGNGSPPELVAAGCLGYCRMEPLVDVCLPGAGRALYAEVDENAAEALAESVAAGRLPAEGALAAIPTANPGAETKPAGLEDVPWLAELPFFARQHKIVLRNCGWVDPNSIAEYAACGGFAALARVLQGESPEDVIAAVETAGLRGRGGGGFPTGRKWRLCREAGEGRHYVICNADEGDPGAYMDRTVLESDPFSVIEGLMIAGYAVGAAEGYIYVRDEYPLAVERLARSIEQIEASGLLGGDILGSGFAFRVHVVRGAGAFVCGEETALIASIEGGQAEPRSKPPYPALQGLWGQPTVVNNVKTLATVPEIVRRGAGWYAGIGTEGNRGTVVFSLVGQVANTGLVEVPLGTTVGQLIGDIGGGPLDPRRPVKAVQTGGPSGGCLPAERFDLPIDYETLAAAGSIMGSGGMVVMDTGTCMVDVARFFLNFTRAESCGKCTPCREGNRVLHELLTRICEGRGDAGDLAQLEEVGRWVKATALCGLGQTAPNPVMSTLRYFRGEYEAHVNEGRCPAGVCRALITLTIDGAKCNGCGLCRRECPADAIAGEKKQPHTIDPDQCTRCRVCLDVCPEGAVAIAR